MYHRGQNAYIQQRHLPLILTNELPGPWFLQPQMSSNTQEETHAHTHLPNFELFFYERASNFLIKLEIQNYAVPEL